MPIAVVKDADGKVIVQVADFGEDPDYLPRVLLNFGGTPALLAVNPTNGTFFVSRDLSHWIAFSAFDCAGEAGIWTRIDIDFPNPYGLEAFTKTTFAVMGPDPDLGTYRVFQSTATSKVDFSHLPNGMPTQVAQTG